MSVEVESRMKVQGSPDIAAPRGSNHSPEHSVSANQGDDLNDEGTIQDLG